MNVRVLIPDTKPDRATKFAAELDDKLKTFATDQARLSFLKGILHNWTRRKERFEQRCATPGYDPGDVTIWDFANTIAEISVRLSRIECAMAQR